MNERQRRLRNIELELKTIYQDLFGAQYVPGLQATDKEEFNSIIQVFRERIFAIRQIQEQREIKQAKKGYKQTAEDIRVNQQVRQDIKRCESILKQAVRRKKNDLKGKSHEVITKLIANRERTLKNCFQLLKDAEQAQEGGSYKPPEQHQTLQDLKHRLVQQIQDEDRVDFQDEEQFEKFKRKDMEIDEGLEEIIQENRKIKEGLKEANYVIDATGEKIRDNLLKADRVNTKLQKGQKDLEQLLVQYRKPNKLCLDITLVLLLLGLIGVIINMIKNTV